MNVITRGMRGATRSPLRSGAIIIMLAISIGLIIAMLAARTGVESKVAEVKANSATGITVTPAGISGFGGGGDPLTAEQVAAIVATEHVVGTTGTLTDQLGTDDTNLTAALELGSFGQRMQRFENSEGDTSAQMPILPESNQSGVASDRPAPTPRTMVTGTTDANSIATDGGNLSISSGKTIDATSNSKTALIGESLAVKNGLNVNSTFTMYNEAFTVEGIFTTGNTFQDSGVIIPLATLQAATEQLGAVTSVAITVDSSENVAGVVESLKKSLGDAADITSNQERAENSVSALESISDLATSGVIGASVAAAVIVFLMMTIIVRERRREIGVIKAIGGTNVKVVGQFVTEALVLTVVGGLVGIVLGTAISGNITEGLVTSSQSSGSSPQEGFRGGPGGAIFRGAQQGLQNVTSTVNPEVIAGGIGITLLIAVIGSAIPALLIARIRPAEVLRTE